MVKESILAQDFPKASLPLAEGERVFSVTELSLALKNQVENQFSHVRVSGEISGLKKHTSGHIYFAIKDDQSVLDVVCWRSLAQKISAFPSEGAMVRCSGQLTTYPGRSRYQLILWSIESQGEGTLLKLLEERKKKLFAEGLFSRKRPIPFLPGAIGLITSGTGAVLRDMIHRIQDRFPCKVYLWSVTVQGDCALEEIITALKGFNRWNFSSFDSPDLFKSTLELFPDQSPNPSSIHQDFYLEKPDVLIVARGGGSIEDLWVFNEEALARAVFESSIPVISAIGHETDTTLIDYVSDLRAPTPTAAAEMALPKASDLQDILEGSALRLYQWSCQATKVWHHTLENLQTRLLQSLRWLDYTGQRLDDRISQFDQLEEKILSPYQNRWNLLSARFSMNPQEIIGQKIQHLQQIWNQIGKTMEHMYHSKFESLKALEKILEAMSYKNVLQRGFSLVFDENNHIVTSVQDLQKSPHACLQIHFKDGQVLVRVDDQKTGVSL
jgi:exodeoxyribonuclease VII large subunit